jgi:hypothetical protein
MKASPRRWCSGPGPRHAAEPILGYGSAKGKCWKHGRWFACSYHAGSPPGCPLCRVETEAEAERSAERESQAREQLEREEAKRERQLLIAEYQGQGHRRDVAESLAASRQREKPRLAEHFQEAAERIRRKNEFEAGTAGTCPVCKEHVPAFEGKILFHEDVYDAGRGERAAWRWEPCAGVGLSAWPPDVRYGRQLPADWED